MLDEVEEDQSVRALVFTSDAEDVFIAHYEVTELASWAGEVAKNVTNPKLLENQPKEPSPMHKLCLRLESMAAITIAAINGSTTGGGFELSLACDFRLLASGRSRVGLPETSIGIIPGAGGTQRYARLLGTAKALDLILHAKLLTPEQALDIGLVHRVFPRDTFHEAAKRSQRILRAALLLHCQLPSAPYKSVLVWHLRMRSYSSWSVLKRQCNQKMPLRQWRHTLADQGHPTTGRDTEG